MDKPWEHRNVTRKNQVICLTHDGDSIVGTTLNGLVHPWNPDLRIQRRKDSKIQDVPTGGRL